MTASINYTYSLSARILSDIKLLIRDEYIQPLIRNECIQLLIKNELGSLSIENEYD